MARQDRVALSVRVPVMFEQSRAAGCTSPLAGEVGSRTSRVYPTCVFLRCRISGKPEIGAIRVRGRATNSEFVEGPSPQPSPATELGFIRVRSPNRVAEVGYTRLQLGEGAHRACGAAVPKSHRNTL